MFIFDNKVVLLMILWNYNDTRRCVTMMHHKYASSAIDSVDDRFFMTNIILYFTVLLPFITVKRIKC